MVFTSIVAVLAAGSESWCVLDMELTVVVVVLSLRQGCDGGGRAGLW